MSPHLLVAISSHGFGHVAQTAAVVNALRTLLPALRLTLRTATPPTLLRSRFTGSFELQPVAADLGMPMLDALTVDVERAAAAYREWHRDWEMRVAGEASELAAARPDLVLANIPYTTLAAAHAAGIPAVALCSLNWADIYRHYCGQRPEAPAIIERMAAAYRSAALFLRPAPSMPMADLDNTLEIGPLAERGQDRRAELAGRLGLEAGERLVLVAMGGIALALPLEAWPAARGVRYLVPDQWANRHPDAVGQGTLGLPFRDLMRSCDALLTKPGYGSFAEAACNGVPVLYVARNDWPEAPYLTGWLHQHGRAREIPRAVMEAGDLEAALALLWAQPPMPPCRPDGAAQAAAHLRRFLA